MFLIGSMALQLHGIDLGREPMDYDLICTREWFNNWIKSSVLGKYKIVAMDMSQAEKAHIKFDDNGKLVIVEASFYDQLDHNQFGNDLDVWATGVSHLYSSERGTKYFERIIVAKPNLCYMLKLSHRYKKNTPFFEKTRRDILALRKLPECKLDAELEGLLKAREALTLQKGYKLNVNKAEFFTDNVPYLYDHDTIHEAVKHFAKPAYQYYMKDGSEVMCDKEKFFALPEEYRLAGVLEEAYVLALERAVIPNGTDPSLAFKIALEKVCTSITSGWFREYAWENYDRVKAMYNPKYVQWFYEALEANQIKPFSRSY
jgi:hypothetical protein